MHDDQTVQRFIERRAQGWTYARLMTELNVSKPTPIAWSRNWIACVPSTASGSRKPSQKKVKKW